MFVFSVLVLTGTGVNVEVFSNANDIKLLYTLREPPLQATVYFQFSTDKYK